MAENKKGFVLYADLIHTIKKMKITDAGELFLHILKYVNDQDPKTDNMIVDLTFEPIKQQLKRDLKHWESKRLARAEAGKKGGLAKASNAKQSVANLAVIVKDKVIVKDINIPSLDEFLDYVKENDKKFLEIKQSATLKYSSWKANGWKDGNDKEIKNWKTKILNTIPHLKREPITYQPLQGTF